MAADYKNILVINLMHIGDLMLVTPVLRTLRANYPSARLTLLADNDHFSLESLFSLVRNNLIMFRITTSIDIGL